MAFRITSRTFLILATSALMLLIMCYDRDPFLGDIFLPETKKSMEITVFLNKDFYKQQHLERSKNYFRKQKKRRCSSLLSVTEIAKHQWILTDVTEHVHPSLCVETKSTGSDRSHKWTKTWEYSLGNKLFLFLHCAFCDRTCAVWIKKKAVKTWGEDTVGKV